MTSGPFQVLFNIPNTIGYIRILFIVVGCLFLNQFVFLAFFVFSAFLDFFDGILARKYKQETAFGEWLDIVIDLFTRGMLWCWSLPEVGFLIFGFEFLVFVCLHSNLSGNKDERGWQESKKSEIHWLAAKTLSKGFKTIPGAIAILGLWALPFWVYIMKHGVGVSILEDMLGFSMQSAASFRFLITAFLITSRFHCCFVECCILKNHIINLVEINT